MVGPSIPRKSVLRRTIATPLILSALLVAVALAAWFAGSRPFNQTVIHIFLQVILVVGLYTFVGNSGIVSFGHIAFAGLGAYVAAWTTINPVMKGTFMPGLPEWLIQTEWPYWGAAIAGAGFAAFWALVLGAALMRLSGIAASIATFAMLALVNTIYSNWDSVTAGTSSVVGIPILRDVGPYLIAAILAVFAAWAFSITRSACSATTTAARLGSNYARTSRRS